VSEKGKKISRKEGGFLIDSPGSRERVQQCIATIGTGSAEKRGRKKVRRKQRSSPSSGGESHSRVGGKKVNSTIILQWDWVGNSPHWTVEHGGGDGSYGGGDQMKAI